MRGDSFRTAWHTAQVFQTRGLVPAMTLAAHQRVLQQRAFLDNMTLMIGKVLVAVNYSFSGRP